MDLFYSFLFVCYYLPELRSGVVFGEQIPQGVDVALHDQIENDASLLLRRAVKVQQLLAGGRGQRAL